MNKSELTDKIAEKVGVSKNQAEEVMDTFINLTIETLKNGGEITLTGFGTFSARQRKGREGINPRNPQQKITIPSVLTAKFKAGKNLKDALKGKESAPKAEKPVEPVKEAPKAEPKEEMPAVESEKLVDLSAEALAPAEVPLETPTETTR